MKQENPDNRQEQTAQPGILDIDRCDSEFIRQAQDFADWIIVRDILAERHSEDKKRADAAAKTFFDMLRRRMNDDDDE